jgi:CheY-like chemotaxis protein
VSKNNEAQIIASRVTAMMDKHGVKVRDKISKVSEILDLSYSQSSRKMLGQSDWDQHQIELIEKHFGEQPGSLRGIIPQVGTIHRGVVRSATFVVGHKRIPCRAWVGTPYKANKKPPDFVAIERKDGWEVEEFGRSSQSGTGTRHYVNHIEISCDSTESMIGRVAILDDDKDLSDSICEYLNEHGFEASSYYSLNKLRQAVATGGFDAYVLDWVIGSDTTEKLIHEIRASNRPKAPIFLLTGQLDTGRAKESEIARVIGNYEVRLKEKPLRLSLLSEELSKTLSSE